MHCTFLYWYYVYDHISSQPPIATTCSNTGKKCMNARSTPTVLSPVFNRNTSKKAAFITLMSTTFLDVFVPFSLKDDLCFLHSRCSHVWPLYDFFRIPQDNLIKINIIVFIKLI